MKKTVLGKTILAAILLPSAAVAAFAQTVSTTQSPVVRATRDLSQPIAVLPFDFDDNQIMIAVKINDTAKPFRFGIDSGSSISVIDTNTAMQLGMRLRDLPVASVFGIKVRVPIHASGYGEKGYKLKSAEHVRLRAVSDSAELPLSQSTYVVTALPKLRSGQALDGLLGYDFLSKYVVAFDYARHTVSLYDRKEYRYTNDGKSIPFKVTSKQGFLQASLKPAGSAPIPAKILLDTGNAGTMMLNTEYVNAHGIIATTPTAPFSRTGPAGTISGRTGRLESLTLGDYPLALPPAGFLQSKGGEAGKKHYDGGLGNGILSRFRVILDFSGQRLYLEPSDDYRKPFDPIVYSGLNSDPVAEGFTLTSVDADSPGASAGFLPGDILVAVDDTPHRRHVHEDIYRAIQGRRETPLLVRRDGKEITLEMQGRTL